MRAIDDIIKSVHSVSEEISKKLLNIYGYPNNIVLHTHPNGHSIWMLGLEKVAEMQIEFSNKNLIIKHKVY